VAVGSVVLISYYRGNSDEASGREMSRSVLPLMLLLMTVFMPLLSADVCRSFYGFLGATASVAELGLGFTFWLAAGFPIMGYVMTMEALLMSRGNTMTPMKGQILGNVINFCLDPLLIFVLEWGVTGAAVATFIGQLAAAVYLRHHMLLQYGERPGLSLSTGILLRWRLILGQGVFITVAYLVGPVGLMMLNKILAQFGPVAVGAWNMMSRTEMMVLLPIMGLSNALAAFISFNMGRKDYERIRQGVVFFFKFSLAVVAPAMILFEAFPYELTAIFRPAPDLLELGGSALRASGVAILFVPILFAITGLAQGLKRPVFMLVISFAYLILARVPLAYLFAGLWSEKGVFWSHPLSGLLAGLLAVVIIAHLLAGCRRQCQG